MKHMKNQNIKMMMITKQQNTVCFAPIMPDMSCFEDINEEAICAKYFTCVATGRSVKWAIPGIVILYLCLSIYLLVHKSLIKMLMTGFEPGPMMLEATLCWVKFKVLCWAQLLE